MKTAREVFMISARRKLRGHEKGTETDNQLFWFLVTDTPDEMIEDVMPLVPPEIRLRFLTWASQNINSDLIFGGAEMTLEDGERLKQRVIARTAVMDTWVRTHELAAG